MSLASRAIVFLIMFVGMNVEERVTVLVFFHCAVHLAFLCSNQQHCLLEGVMVAMLGECGTTTYIQYRKQMFGV